MALCDALFLGPHPDDVEIACSGAILRLVGSGKKVAIVDCTGGEMGSQGTAAERKQEAIAAAATLGVAERRNLDLPDTAVAVDDDSIHRLVRALRELRPQLLFAPHEKDVHPDHVAAAHLASKAWFFAGLRRYEPDLGEPHRPRMLIRYPGNIPAEPTFALDISDLAEKKAAAIRCYRSQLVADGARAHLVQRLDILERAQVRDRFYGARTGCALAEPYVVDGPVLLRDLGSLFA